MTYHEISKTLIRAGLSVQMVKDPRCVIFREFAHYTTARKYSVAWLRADIEPYTQAGCIVTDKKMPIKASQVITPNPRLAFVILLNQFIKMQPNYIHPTAIIHPEAEIGENVGIGAYTFIDKCRIGNNTRIYAQCYIGSDTYIGNDCEIWHGAVIGSDGFGYESLRGEWLKFHSLGGVYIGNNVSIGAHTCVDRGTLGDTKIHNGVKIDNLVHIAHNVEIMDNAVIVANSMIAGSVRIESGAWVAPSVNVLNGVTVGNNTVIGMGANVLKDVPGHETWIGNPAKKLR